MCGGFSAADSRLPSPPVWEEVGKREETKSLRVTLLTQIMHRALDAERARFAGL
jgi:hypothetical protein